MANRKPKCDEVIDGIRVRVFSTRSEYEVLVGEGDISDPEANVWVYPKVFGIGPSARQAVLDSRNSS